MQDKSSTRRHHPQASTTARGQSDRSKGLLWHTEASPLEGSLGSAVLSACGKLDRRIKNLIPETAILISLSSDLPFLVFFLLRRSTVSWSFIISLADYFSLFIFIADYSHRLIFINLIIETSIIPSRAIIPWSWREREENRSYLDMHAGSD